MCSTVVLFCLVYSAYGSSPGSDSYEDEAGVEHGTANYGPFTDDFQLYLKKNNLEQFDFLRADQGKSGSFGGRMRSDEIVSRIPVVFIHGNSDSALYSNNFSTGWDQSLRLFMKDGYSLKELYGMSWGTTVTIEAIQRYHSCAVVRRIRAFIKAVLGYTGSAKVSIITHSMGTTLVRKAIQGGHLNGPDGESCKIGRPLAYRVDVLIGISSANAGLCWCAGAGAMYPTCNAFNGFFVSTECGGASSAECSRISCGAQRSELLATMTGKDAHKVYSIWSSADELVGGGGMVWGQQTHIVPNSDGFKIYPNLTHMQTKDYSADVQLQMISGRF